MTQVKLWQIVSQTPNGIVFSDADGNLKSLPQGTVNQLLVAGPDGAPIWAENTALTTALQAKTDATSALDAAKAYTEAQIAALVNNAPMALNTLNELAQKLTGDESAINALLLQMDGKAAKSDVATQVSQAKQEAIDAAKDNTTVAVSNALSAVDSQIAGTRSEILSTSSQYADSRANNARDSAILAANSFATQSVAQVKQEASQDAASKASTAKSEAITTANVYTDTALNSGLASMKGDAQVLANSAKDTAIAIAEQDSTNKVSQLRDSIPGVFWAEGTSTACFVANAINLNMEEAIGAGLMVSQHFTEVTGAAVTPNDPLLNAKLLFVNGVAMGEDWTPSRIGNNELAIRFGPQLAHHVFDGTQNSVMLLAEYKSYNSISLRS